MYPTKLHDFHSFDVRSYIISNERALLLGLVDIIFAYCYDYRTQQGESTVESAWTIGTLSPTLSCLEVRTTFVRSRRHCFCCFQLLSLLSRHFIRYKLLCSLVIEGLLRIYSYCTCSLYIIDVIGILFTVVGN